MPKFVKLLVEEVTNNEGDKFVHTRKRTPEELKELIAAYPQAVIEVPESHADRVIRRQGKYQELDERLLGVLLGEDGDGEVEVEAEPTTKAPAKKPARRRAKTSKTRSSSVDSAAAIAATVTTAGGVDVN